MPAVAVLALGSMGKAIAGALAQAGVDVVAWNRTPLPADAIPDGVQVRPSVRDAVADAWLVIAVPSAYEDTRSVLAELAADGALRGRVLLNLSWGSLADAEEMQRWCSGAGIAYLDGNLMCYADDIGTPSGRLVVSGTCPELDRVLDLWRLVGPVQHLGPDPAAANALGTAAGVVFYHSALAAFYESIAFASRFGVSPAAMVPEIRAMFDLLGSHLDADVAALEAQQFDDPNANLMVHVDGVRLAIADLEAAGQPAPLLRGFLELAQPLLDAGYADQSIGRLYDVLRSSSA
jgi:3-hydroxyisobutyrate dehydrogenase-like beta-hydroxyacid dehydrogenase